MRFAEPGNQDEVLMLKLDVEGDYVDIDVVDSDGDHITTIMTIREDGSLRRNYLSSSDVPGLQLDSEGRIALAERAEVKEVVKEVPAAPVHFKDDVFLGLEDLGGGRVKVHAVDSKGRHLPAGNIISFDRDGKISKYGSLGPGVFRKDRVGSIIVDDDDDIKASDEKSSSVHLKDDVYLKLEKDSHEKSVVLKAVDKDGDEIDSGFIAEITKEGTLGRFDYVNEALFKVDGRKKIALKGADEKEGEEDPGFYYGGNFLKLVKYGCGSIALVLVDENDNVVPGGKLLALQHGQMRLVEGINPRLDIEVDDDGKLTFGEPVSMHEVK